MTKREDAQDGDAATSPSAITDEVRVEVDGVDVTDGPTVPKRPAESATKGEWVEYAVALGADRTFITEGGEYVVDAGNGATEPAGGLTKAEIVDLCDRLGG